MWTFLASTKMRGTARRISRPQAARIRTLLTIALGSMMSLQACLPQNANTHPLTQNLSIHLDRLLVSSAFGFGVQLDPYEYPPTEARWQQIEARLDVLHPAFLRVMFRADIYCRKLTANSCGEYVWNGKEQDPPEQYTQLLRILYYAQAHQLPVMIGEWSWPRLPHASNIADIRDPADPRWAEIIAGLLTHLTRDKKYTVLRWYNYMNEPNGGWMWPGGNAGVNYAAWMKGYLHARTVFDRAGLRQIALVGPDNSADWDWLDRTAHDAASATGGWEMHWYPRDPEVLSGKVYRLLNAKRELLLRVDPNAKQKPRYLGEAGLLTGRVHGDQQPRVRTFEYGLLMADFAAQVMQAGWMGASAWDLDDAMHPVSGHPPVPGPYTLKIWGFWNTQGPAMGQPEDDAVRPWFRPWALLAHGFPAGAQVFAVSDPEQDSGLRAVAARHSVNGKPAWMILLVNVHPQPFRLRLQLPLQTARDAWSLFPYTRTIPAGNYLQLHVSQAVSVRRGSAEIDMPAESVLFVTNDVSLR